MPLRCFDQRYGQRSGSYKTQGGTTYRLWQQESQETGSAATAQSSSNQSDPASLMRIIVSPPAESYATACARGSLSFRGDRILQIYDVGARSGSLVETFGPISGDEQKTSSRCNTGSLPLFCLTSA
jgi:hypothetical protein